MKRFTDTNIWDEDWFITMPTNYKLLWIWIKDRCDHAGIWKPNVENFKIINGEVDLEKAVEYFNTLDKERIIKLANGKFFLPGFFVFQYGKKLNLNNKVHQSVFKVLNSNGVNLWSIRGLEEVIETPGRGQDGVNLTPKDKEKDKDILNTNTTTVYNLTEDCEKFISQYGKGMVEAFLRHWREKVTRGKNRGKEKWQLEETWETDLRLAKWKYNIDTDFGRKQPIEPGKLNSANY